MTFLVASWRAPRRPAGAARSRPRARDGFTVVEIIVAIMILSIGVLGLASTAVVVQKQMGLGERQAAAATIAQGRFDNLTSVNCKDPAVANKSGTASWRGGQVKESWVTRQHDNVLEITDSVKITGFKKTLVYNSYVPCRN